MITEDPIRPRRDVTRPKKPGLSVTVIGALGVSRGARRVDASVCAGLVSRAWQRWPIANSYVSLVLWMYMVSLVLLK